MSTFIAVVFGTLAGFITLGTAIDVLRLVMRSYNKEDNHDPPSFGLKLLLSFSIYTNLIDIMSTKSSGNKDTLTCLHGLRFISMSWVVLGHNFSFISSQLLVKNPLYLWGVYAGDLGFAFEAVLNAMPSVDSFFLFRKVYILISNNSYRLKKTLMLKMLFSDLTFLVFIKLDKRFLIFLLKM